MANLAFMSTNSCETWLTIIQKRLSRVVGWLFATILGSVGAALFFNLDLCAILENKLKLMEENANHWCSFICLKMLSVGNLKVKCM